ncbi:hypothetical protein Bca4012_011001 [Brassica carinata]
MQAYGRVPPPKNHTDRERPVHTTSSQRADRLPEFQQRLDRHGSPFGERVSASTVGVRDPKNKITPASGRDSHDRKRSSDIELRLKIRRFPLRGDRTRTTIVSAITLLLILCREHGTRPLMRNTHQEQGLNQFQTPLSTHALPEQSIPPVPSLEMVMDELREATLQYTNHPDPIESAARRQRVLDGEVHGLMEKTAASIIAAAYELHQQQSLRNAALQAVAASTNQGVVPSPNVILLPASSSVPVTKRRGRPPKAKKQNPSPGTLAGASSRK